MVEEGKAKQRELMEQVTANRNKRIEGMNAYLNEDKKEMQEKIDKLQKEYEEKAHCLEDNLEAHKKMKEQVLGSLGKLPSASFLRAEVNSHGAPAGEKMRYIEENKILEKKVADAKDMIQNYHLQEEKYNAIKVRSDVDLKHWQKLLTEMVLQMKTEEEDLRALITVLDKRCAEVEELSKPEVATAVQAIPQQAEKEKREREAEKARKEAEARARARSLREKILAKLRALKEEAARRIRQAQEEAARRIREALTAAANIFRGWR